MIATLARKSLRARWGRNLFIALAIAFGVSFVSGSFVLADSMRATFNELFDDLSEGIDLQIRARLQGADIVDGAVRDPLPDDIVDAVAAVPGVQYADPNWSRFAQIIDPDGEPLSSSGAPQFGTAWYEPRKDFPNLPRLLQGAAPQGPDQVVLEQKTADHAGYQVGDTVPVVLSSGRQEFLMTGIVGMPDGSGIGGAQLVGFDPAHTADILGAGDFVDVVDIVVTPGADVAATQAAIEAVLPPVGEVITAAELAEETKDAIGTIIDAFGTGLLVFAVITSFVSASSSTTSSASPSASACARWPSCGRSERTPAKCAH